MPDSSLTSIQLPASLTNIGSCAFRDCSSLTSQGLSRAAAAPRSNGLLLLGCSIATIKDSYFWT